MTHNRTASPAVLTPAPSATYQVADRATLQATAEQHARRRIDLQVYGLSDAGRAKLAQYLVAPRS